MGPGFEGGIDIRRPDGTLDGTIGLIARNGEVHVTITVEAEYGMGQIVIDLLATDAHELSGAFREAAQAAGPAEVAEPRRSQAQWTAQQVGHVLGERD